MRDRERLREQGTVEITERRVWIWIGLQVLGLLLMLIVGFWLGGGQVRPSSEPVGDQLELGDQIIARLLAERRGERVESGERGLPEVRGAGAPERAEPPPTPVPEAGEPPAQEPMPILDVQIATPQPADEAPPELRTEVLEPGAVDLQVEVATPVPTAAPGGRCGPIDFAPVPGEGDWTVQVAAYPDPEASKAMVDHLRANCFRAYEAIGIVNGKTWHRVRVGQYDSREAAVARGTELTEFTEYEPIPTRVQ